MRRRLKVGAEPVSGGAHFRVWAPRRARVDVVVEGGPRTALEPEENGYFSGLARGVGAGARYRFALDDERELYPDPASRAQPEGPHGPSMVIDPTRFEWTDHGWRGRSLREAVIQEVHIGTFTRAGTWAAATAELPALARLGITVIEMMPVAEFPGVFGWGYDGVDVFAPYHGYGTPDDLRAFVDRAHALGIAVLLDVVYNHLGPDGCYLRAFSLDYFTDRHTTEWGEPINFDGENSAEVRELFASNAEHWIDEHHFDGLRVDATQSVFDAGPGEHFLAELTRRVREAAPDRTLLVIGESEPQRVEIITPREAGGHGMDALWNDDFHHSALVALTGRNEAYYSDHRGTAQELVSALEHGFLFQGQRYAWQQKRRGTPTLGVVPPERFITFLENHDQVANTLDGRRLHALTSPAMHRALTSLVLLGPGTPMLFQGEEILSSAPFLYFADHEPELAAKVRRGRTDFLAQFPSVSRSIERLADPADPATFERCKLDREPSAAGAAHAAMIGALLARRRSDPVLDGSARQRLDGAVLERDALVLRAFGRAPGDDRLLITNLGPSRRAASLAEPLVAPPYGSRWAQVFASEDPEWGGRGAPTFEQDDGVCLTAACTILLVAHGDPDARADGARTASLGGRT